MSLCRYVAMSTPPLVLARSVRRPCRHHSAGHADAAAVSAEAFAEAGGAGRGVYSVGQRLPGEGEHWRGCVGSIQSRTRSLTVSRSNREAVDRMLKQKGLRPFPPAMNADGLGDVDEVDVFGDVDHSSEEPVAPASPVATRDCQNSDGLPSAVPVVGAVQEVPGCWQAGFQRYSVGSRDGNGASRPRNPWAARTPESQPCPLTSGP